MEREIISENERELLRTPSARPARAADGTNAQPDSPYSSGTDFGPRHLARRPDRAITDTHSSFASQLGRTISDLARQPVSARLRDDWVGTYAEFVFGQPLPTCCAVMSSSAHAVELYGYIEPQMLFSLLDRTLGVGPTAPPPVRALSEIEQALARFLFEQIAHSYADRWKQAFAFELDVERIIHNVQQAKLLPGGEPCYIARYELSCGRDFGRMEICLPWQATESIRPRLATP